MTLTSQIIETILNACSVMTNTEKEMLLCQGEGMAFVARHRPTPANIKEQDESCRDKPAD